MLTVNVNNPEGFLAYNQPFVEIPVHWLVDFVYETDEIVTLEGIEDWNEAYELAESWFWETFDPAEHIHKPEGYNFAGWEYYAHKDAHGLVTIYFKEEVQK